MEQVEATESAQRSDAARATRASRALQFADRTAWIEFQRRSESTLAGRWQIEQALPAAVDPGTGSLPAYCRICEAPVELALPSLARGGTPNLREELACSGCHLNARVRSALSILRDVDGLADSDDAIYITEQASYAYAWLRRRYPGVVGTEFYANKASRRRLETHLKHLLGEAVPARFGDVTALGFDDGSFDAVISFDVLEHVPDYPAALGEFARILRSGGSLVLTAPFLPGEPETEVCARVRADGTTEHILPPEYHGDPLSPEGGVLCYYHFGWDLLDAVRTAGFSSASFVLPWHLAAGEIGSCWTLLATR